MVDRFGIVGLASAIILIVWFVGWMFFGMHAGLWHFLFLIGAFLGLMQGVRRIARAPCRSGSRGPTLFVHESLARTTVSARRHLER